METLAIAKTLQKIDGIEHDEAYNIAEAINGRSGLATREDLAEVKAELKEDISEVKAEIAEVKTDIARLENNQKWIMVILIAVNVPTLLIIIGMAFKMFTG